MADDPNTLTIKVVVRGTGTVTPPPESAEPPVIEPES